MQQMKSAARTSTVAGALAALLLASVPALSQEPGRSGFYVGGHMGYLFGNGTATLADPIGVQSAGGTTPYGTDRGPPGPLMFFVLFGPRAGSRSTATFPPAQIMRRARRPRSEHE